MTNFGGPADPNAIAARANGQHRPLGAYDDLLGKTYTGDRDRSAQHAQVPGDAQLPRCQVRCRPRTTQDTVFCRSAWTRDERTLFDGVDLVAERPAAVLPAHRRRKSDRRTPRRSRRRCSRPPSARSTPTTMPPVMQPLTAGLRALRTLRSQLATMNGLNDSARYEIDYRLGQKEQEFQQALLLANNVRVETLADDGVVVPGQSVKVTAIVANRGSADVAVKQVSFVGFDAPGACALTEVASANIFGQAGPGGGRGGQARPAPRLLSTLKRNQVAQCAPSMTVPASARATEPHWHRAGDAGLHLRHRCAVRLAPSPDAVHREDHHDARHRC